MPLFNWLKCTDGLFQYARIDNKNNVIKQSDVIAWEKIYDNYLDVFGLNDAYKKLLKNRSIIAQTQCDFIVTKQAKLFNVIRTYEAENKKLESMMKVGMTTEQVLVHLSKMQHQHINTKEITVAYYKALIKEYERNN